MMNSNSNRSKKLRAAQPRAPPPHARRRHRNAGSRSSAEPETFNSSISSRTTVQHPDEQTMDPPPPPQPEFGSRYYISGNDAGSRSTSTNGSRSTSKNNQRDMFPTSTRAYLRPRVRAPSPLYENCNTSSSSQSFNVTQRKYGQPPPQTHTFSYRGSSPSYGRGYFDYAQKDRSPYDSQSDGPDERQESQENRRFGRGKFMKKDQAIESEFQPPKCPFVCTADEIKPYEEMKVSLLPATLVPTVPACIEMINAYLETDSYYDMTKMYNASNVEQLKSKKREEEARGVDLRHLVRYDEQILSCEANPGIFPYMWALLVELFGEERLKRYKNWKKWSQEELHQQKIIEDEDDEEFLNFVPESPTENEKVGQQVRKGRNSGPISRYLETETIPETP